MLEFFGVLAAAVGHADGHVALDADARMAHEIGEDQRQRAIGHDLRHARPAQAFRRGLGHGRLAVARETAGRRKVARAGHFIGAGETAGPVHLDIAENKD